jgi:HAD superfamily hydrolase (TIGR01509 family)
MTDIRFAVIWDMDGVIVDTGRYHFRAWKDVLEPLNISFSWEDFRQTFGMNNYGLLTKLFGYPPTPILISQIADKKEERFRELIKGKIKLEPGVFEWINQISRFGYLQAIASSAPQANIDQLLDELSICQYFQTVVSAEKMPGKPDPTVFLSAAANLGVSPGNSIVIEDSVAGLSAAQKAGMKCIAITSTNPKDLLLTAEIVIENFSTINPSIVRKLFLEG